MIFLDGFTPEKDLMEQLREQMQEASKDLEFEKAASLRGMRPLSRRR